jgi:hypothetical protein
MNFSKRKLNKTSSDPLFRTYCAEAWIKFMASV